MAKLNQIVAVTAGRKSHAKGVIEEIYHKLQKKELLQGLVRTYQAKDEDGEQMPDERKGVQLSVPDAIKEAVGAWSSLCDVVATQDMANTLAKADVAVDGRVLLKAVPITHLLFLEHQLVDLQAFVSKLPTLDPADEWEWDDNSNQYRSSTGETLRTKKVPKAFVKYDATKEHPAQVEAFMEDVVIGTYRLTKFSGAIPAQEKVTILSRVRLLQEAVKRAREEANGIDVQDVKEGASLFDFVFKK